MRIAVLVGVLATAGFFAWIRLQGPEAGSQPATAAIAPQPQELAPTVVEAAPEPAAGVSASTAPGRERQVGIYECTRDGQRVVSDRPCGPDAEQRTLSVSQPDPAEAVAAQQRARATLMTAAPAQSAGAAGSATPAAPVAADAGFAQEARCAAIDRAIEGINARMRQGGYGTEEGNWLRGQWHKLKDEWYDLKCRKSGVD